VPSMQAQQDAGSNSTAFTDAATAQRILHDTDNMMWSRKDWNVPVGTFSAFQTKQHDTSVEGHLLRWWSFKVDRLHLSHRATMYLLQGISLSNLLLPSHYIQKMDGSEVFGEVGQLVLRVDPWNYWLPRPVVTGLTVVTVELPPRELALEKVLEALVAASAS
jgi:hypothetical protein